MHVRPLFCLTLALAIGIGTAVRAEHKLEPVKQAPAGVSKDVAATLGETGQKVTGPDGAVATVWLAKSVEVKPNFKPSLSVKYPFMPGQLIGVIEVAEKSGMTDFRGQEIPAGTYTLRYGQQPQDGNHIGTSELADFLLALPAKGDTSAKPIAGFDELSEKSAKTAGSTHPAIFSLLPAEKGDKDASVTHDSNTEFVILNVTVNGKDQDKSVSVPMRVVVVGVSEG